MGVLKEKLRTKDQQKLRIQLDQVARALEKAESTRLDEFTQSLASLHSALLTVTSALSQLASKEYPEPKEVEFPETQTVELTGPIEIKKPTWWKLPEFTFPDFSSLLQPLVSTILDKLDHLRPPTIQKVLLVDEEGRPIIFSKLSPVLQQAPRKMFRGGKGTEVNDEVLSGTVDGANTVFTLSQTPVSGTLRLYLNGSRQRGGGVDFTLSGRTIMFVTAPPQGGQAPVADYTY